MAVRMIETFYSFLRTWDLISQPSCNAIHRAIQLVLTDASAVASSVDYRSIDSRASRSSEAVFAVRTRLIGKQRPPGIATDSRMKRPLEVPTAKKTTRKSPQKKIKEYFKSRGSLRNSPISVASSPGSFLPSDRGSSFVPAVSSPGSVLPSDRGSLFAPTVSLPGSVLPSDRGSSLMPAVSSPGSVMPSDRGFRIIPAVSSSGSVLPIDRGERMIPAVSAPGGFLPDRRRSRVIPVVSSPGGFLPSERRSRVIPAVSQPGGFLPSERDSHVLPVVFPPEGFLPSERDSHALPVVFPPGCVVPSERGSHVVPVVYPPGCVLPSDRDSPLTPAVSSPGCFSPSERGSLDLPVVLPPRSVLPSDRGSHIIPSVYPPGGFLPNERGSLVKPVVSPPGGFLPSERGSLVKSVVSPPGGFLPSERGSHTIPVVSPPGGFSFSESDSHVISLVSPPGCSLPSERGSHILPVVSPPGCFLPSDRFLPAKAPLARRNPGSARLVIENPNVKSTLKAKTKSNAKAKTQSMISTNTTARAKATRKRSAASSSSSPKRHSIRRSRRAVFTKDELNARRRKAALVVRQREQTRLRMARFRNKVKERTAEARMKMLEKARRYADGFRECRRLTQFCRDSVSWILTVGTTPSPSGSRAPIAKTISHIKTSISRWTVSFWRDRSFILYRMFETERFTEFMNRRCIGIHINWDNSPLRTWADGQDCRSRDVMVKTIRGINSNGECERMLAPKLHYPADQKTFGLLGSLLSEETYTDELFADPERFRFIILSSDGCATNLSAIRFLTASFVKNTRGIIVPSLCWLHIVCNATRWGLSIVDFCSLLRLAHAIQYSPSSRLDFSAHLSSIVSDVKLQPLVKDEDIAYWTNLWVEYIGLILGQKGPFSGYDVSGQVREIATRAVFLYPRGIPFEDQDFCLVEGSAIHDYSVFLGKLFHRTFPSPLIQRFYTVERSCWIIDALRRFKVLAAVIPSSLDIKFWPGDDFLADGDNGVDVKRNASNRSKRIALHARSDTLKIQLLVATTSSRPRWHFARALLAKKDDTSSIIGLPRAVEAMVNDSRRMIYGYDVLTNVLLSNETNKHIARLAVFRSVSASVLYVGDKYKPYTTPVWKIILGVSRPETFNDCIGHAPCCSASGIDTKLDAVFADLSGEEFEMASEEATVMLGALCVAFRNASNNNLSESLFAILRALGLKYPHRPCRLATLYRELTNHFYLNKQSLFVKALIEDCFGSVEELNRVAAGKKSIYNSWTAYLRAFKMAASRRSSSLWSDVTADQRTTWVTGAGKQGVHRNQGATDKLEILNSYDKVGPLGSVDKRNPLDLDLTMERLEDSCARFRG